MLECTDDEAAVLTFLLLYLTLVSKDLTKRLLVAVNSGDDTVALVDPRHSEVIARVATRAHAQDVMISPDGSFRLAVSRLGLMSRRTDARSGLLTFAATTWLCSTQRFATSFGESQPDGAPRG